jgi:hypothetical protein
MRSALIKPAGDIKPAGGLTSFKLCAVVSRPEEEYFTSKSKTEKVPKPKLQSGFNDKN